MGITPKLNGFVQDTYADFMGRAVNGMLANASDVNLTDGVFVGEVKKAYAGHCYGLKDGALVAMASGIEPVFVCFEQGAMDSDDDGNYEVGTAKVLRSARVGGRIWIEVVAKGATVDSSAVLYAGTDGKITDAAEGTDISTHAKVVGTYTATDGKALCLVEVF